VALKVRARKFFSDRQGCERRIICERLAEVSARSRKTAGLEKAPLSIILRLGSEVGARLARWLRDGEASKAPVMKRFAEGLTKDLSAVQAGLTEGWSNGPV
jgi:transposase